MHSAPSVSYPVGRSRFAGAFALAAWLLGAGAALAWRLSAPPSAWRFALVVAALVIAGALALASWLRPPAGQLAWTGEAWAWSGDQGASGGIETTIDLQRWLLVRFTTPVHSRWLWLERSRAPQHWDDLRRAVYSRARPQALPGQKAPSATS